MNTQARHPVFRRKRYLIAAKFQLKYAGLILLLMFAIAGLCAYVVYYTTLVLLGEKLANVYPQGQLVHIVKTVNIRLLASMVLVSPMVVAFGILLSHKIAGPMYRIERFLNDMAAGDYTTRLTLRKSDEFTGLAAAINNVLDSVKSVVGNQRTRLSTILNETALLRDKLPDAAAANRLESEIIELLKAIEKYKI